MVILKTCCQYRIALSPKCTAMKASMILPNNFTIRIFGSFKKPKPDDIEAISINNSLLAEVYQKEGDLEKSNGHFLKSLKYALHNNGTSNSIITSASNIAQNHIRLKNADSAVYYLSISRKQMSAGHHYLPSYHQVKSEISTFKPKLYLSTYRT